MCFFSRYLSMSLVLLLFHCVSFSIIFAFNFPFVFVSFRIPFTWMCVFILLNAHFVAIIFYVYHEHTHSPPDAIELKLTFAIQQHYICYQCYHSYGENWICRIIFNQYYVVLLEHWLNSIQCTTVLTYIVTSALAACAHILDMRGTKWGAI